MIQYTWLAHFVILCWILFRIGRWVLPDSASIIFALAITLLLSMIENVFMLYFVALLDPLGLLLPLLAVRNVVGIFTDNSLNTLSLIELIGWLVAGVVFIASALGVFEMDLYSFGYSDLPAAVIATGASLYFAWRRQVLLLVVSVLGYLLWVFDVGSSNYFDHVFHAFMVPVLVIQLVYRLIEMAKRGARARVSVER